MAEKVLEAIKTRCSVRAYTDEAVTCEEIKTVVTAGLQAPTATNRQELHFSVLKNGGEALNALKAAMGSEFYYNAPVVVLISGEAAFSWSACDAGIAVENMALAAEALGLGNVILGCIKQLLLKPESKELCEKLAIPEGYNFEVALAFGHTAKGKEPHTYDEAAQVSWVD